jgi:hypothetical protein
MLYGELLTLSPAVMDGEPEALPRAKDICHGRTVEFPCFPL